MSALLSQIRSSTLRRPVSSPLPLLFSALVLSFRLSSRVLGELYFGSSENTRLTDFQQLYLLTSKLPDHPRLCLRHSDPHHGNIHIRPSQEKSSRPSCPAHRPNHWLHHCLRHSKPCSRLLRYVPLRRRHLQLQLPDPHLDINEPRSRLQAQYGYAILRLTCQHFGSCVVEHLSEC